MSRLFVFLTAVIGLGLMSLTSAATPSAETAPKVLVKTVAATFPAEVTIVTWQFGGGTRKSEPPASGEIWMVVKATSSEGTNWGGYPVNGAVVRDTSGKKYSAVSAVPRESGEPEFYANVTSFLGKPTTVMFLFSIPANSKGLKFSYGDGVELAIPQSPPSATSRATAPSAK